jgi:hypothetical protein
MENYYSDRRVLYALEKSSEDEGSLMDILTFVKEIDFEIKDNLGFDVLWDSLNGRRCINVDTSLGKLRPEIKLSKNHKSIKCVFNAYLTSIKNKKELHTAASNISHRVTATISVV